MIAGFTDTTEGIVAPGAGDEFVGRFGFGKYGTMTGAKWTVEHV